MKMFDGRPVDENDELILKIVISKDRRMPLHKEMVSQVFDVENNDVYKTVQYFPPQMMESGFDHLVREMKQIMLRLFMEKYGIEE